MGKRKERRRAAISAAGRRVKLDLFAEPSGDVVGTTAHDEVGKDLDQDHHASAPSSGHQPENPLLLLGQYSDDELDEETNESEKCDERESSPDDQNGDENNSLNAKNEEDRSNEPRNNVSSDVKQENGEVDDKKHVNANAIGVSDLTSVTTPCSQADATTQVCVSDSSGIQIAGDLADGWKIVMLEENGSYYYWNTVTGETSWEVPVIMTQGTDTSDALVHENYSTANGNGSTHMITESDEKSNVVLNAGEDEGRECQNQEILNSVGSSNQTVAKGGSTEVCVLYDQAAERSRLISSQRSSSLAMEYKGMEATCKDPFIPTSGENKGESNENLEAAQLVDYSESLLKRLQSLARSGGCTRGQDWTSKCITEVEIRLADCTTLSPYGSSLLPFWCHIETQLKQLEVIIIEEETSLVLKSKDPTKVENEHIIMHGLTNVSLPSVCLEDNDVEKGSGVEYTTAENALSSHGANNVEVQNEINHVVSCKGTPEVIHDNELEAKMKQETSENAISSPSVYKMNPHDGEDIDMDVEMEVDEGTTVDHAVSEEPSTAECSASQEHQFNFYPPSFTGTPAAPCDECIVPPLPDEEWIPPPPPDYEPIPPPPPEEPPTSSYPPPPPEEPPTSSYPPPPPEEPPTSSYPPPPPSYTEILPPLPYTEQYNLAYTIPTYEYYATISTEMTNPTYYPQIEGCQIAQPQPTLYYESTTIAIPEAVTKMANPAEPMAYHEIPNVIVSTGSVVSSVDSSGYISGPISYNVAADQALSAAYALTSGGSSLPGLAIQPRMLSSASETVATTSQVAPKSVNAPAAETASVSENSTDAPSLPAAKNQSKVRSKKRTAIAIPSLRSNKKVSSLVDKWKAAKEELHGNEDDEPDDPYEILKRKKEKEIEEWRARQIASGEAQDNANFQPLGGDWRERVKRRRAQLAAKTAQAPMEPSADEDKQPPKLTELSKDLPAGWQAYWDESSKGVYYGNTITSETSWTRPSK